VFELTDDETYWHFAYEAHEDRLAELSERWTRACDEARAFADGAIVHPSHDVLASCLGGTPTEDLGELYERALASCVRDTRNLGLGGHSSWNVLSDLAHALPPHPGVKGMSGWGASWAAGPELAAAIERDRDSVAAPPPKSAIAEACANDPGLAPAALRMLERYARVAAAGHAVLCVLAKNPFV
jgi:hypothetical protein